MSSIERKKISLKSELKDTAMLSAPPFPDFAQVYQKVDVQAKKEEKGFGISFTRRSGDYGRFRDRQFLD